MIINAMVASVMRHYPFASGCGRIANHYMPRILANRRGDPMVWAPVGKYQLLVPHNDFVGRAVYYFGDLDRKISWLVRTIFREGDAAVDVGANLGWITLCMAQAVGSNGSVIAFEPQGHLAAMLRESLAVNGLDHVTLQNVGVGAEKGTAALNIANARNAGSTKLVGAASDGSIPIVRLDDVIKGHVRLIKIDVEGMEPDVLKGASALLRNESVDALIVETHEDGEASEILLDCGYKLYHIGRWMLAPRLHRHHRPCVHDTLAIHQGQAELIAWAESITVD